MTTPGEQGHADPPTEHLAFSVDTHLLRELGSLLVGRDSTALVELIKNAYDADATRIVVHGERLSKHGMISIDDDGHGMTYSDFVHKFLRIAGRSKEEGTRRSPTFERRFTGAKGIGRLSAHKLGESLGLESNPNLDVLDRESSDRGFRAEIDWSAIEASEASMEEAREIEAQPDEQPPDGRIGTFLTINRLHSAWTPRLLGSFLAEVRSTRPDEALVSPPPAKLFIGEPLIPTIDVADTSSSDPGFTVELSGDFAGTDSQWPTLLSHVTWMIEIDARHPTQVVYQISPAASVRKKHADVQPSTFEWTRKMRGPQFVARIFVRDGLAESAKLPDVLSKFTKDAAGVRLFFEGFRVLPYGAPRNDWLGLGASYSQRGSLELLEDIAVDSGSRSTNDERTYQLSNNSYFGAAFLHDSGSAGLKMVVNREGFLPGEELDELTDIIRRGINLSVRTRAALGALASEAKETERSTQKDRRFEKLLEESRTRRGEESTASIGRERIDAWLRAGEEAAMSIRKAGPAAGPLVARDLEVVSAALEEVRSASDAAASEQSQLRVLASLGTQVGAFVHEVNGILGQARTVRDLLDTLIDDPQSSSVRTRLRAARDAQTAVIVALERQAVYLSDSLGAEARSRRVRQKVAERWATAVRLLGGAADRRNVHIAEQLPPGLRTPPMFASELNVVLTNLLSNAIKAAALGDSEARGVRVTGSSDAGGVSISIENTGASIDLSESERWFRAFETTTSELDAVLGQGLGLGLPLTRRIVEEYGGSIQFIEPSSDMATAINVWLPDR